ncbi:MAG: DNA recombination protein RmuC [Elusimicrobiaceae bacterium]|nr:DNA recombination protein RmuC [Elusimicrobiaceae bacterium]
MTILIYLLLGIALGGAGMYFYQRVQKDVLVRENAKMNTEIQALTSFREQNAALSADNARLQAQNEALSKERVLVEKNFAEVAATYRAQFADLATKILEEKSKGLESKNTEVLRPLTLQLESFVKKVHDMERVTTEKQAQLEKGLSDVLKSTEKIDQSAISLTNAIKGEAIVRGSWGEEALKRILDSAGMKEGVDYFEQVSEEGKRVDVQIALPSDRWIVVDSKTIFNHYVQYYNEQDPKKKEEHLAAHVKDVKKTIRDLSSKKYYKKFQETGEKVQPDYTLMFVYPESALLAAVSEDADVLNEAWKNNIALVSATSLLSTLKMVSKLWDIDKQHEYMDELKEDIQKLMEKFNDFLVNFAKAENAISNAFDAVKVARGHIDSNKGSFLPVAQRIIDVYEAPLTKENARLLKRMNYDYNGSKKRVKQAENETSSVLQNQQEQRLF